MSTITIPFATREHSWFSLGVYLSMIGITFIFFTIYYLKLSKQPLTRMILWISIADTIFAVPVLLLSVLPGINEGRCITMILIAHYGVVCSFCWAACFSHALKVYIDELDEYALRNKFKLYLLLSMTLPIPATVGAAFTNFVQYDDVRGLCFHEMFIGEFDVSFMVFNDFFYMGATIACIYYSIASVISMMKLLKENRDWYVFKILLYPLLLVVFWVPKIVNDFCIQMGQISILSQDFAKLLEIFVQAQGFINAVVFGLSHAVISGYKSKFCKTDKRCLKRRKSQNSAILSSSVHSNSSEGELSAALFRRAQSRAIAPSSYGDSSMSGKSASVIHHSKYLHHTPSNDDDA